MQKTFFDKTEASKALRVKESEIVPLASSLKEFCFYSKKHFVSDARCFLIRSKWYALKKNVRAIGTDSEKRIPDLRAHSARFDLASYYDSKVHDAILKRGETRKRK